MYQSIITEKLDKIISKYLSDKKYGNLRHGHWEKRWKREFLWQVYYEDKDNSTMSIRFKGYNCFLFWNYSVSGRMTESGRREKDFKTFFLDTALIEFEKRISEIPYNIENF